MPPLHEDYLLRIIKQATEALAKAFALKRSGDHELATHEIDTAISLLLGPQADVIAAVDTATAVSLLEDRKSAALYARLLSARGELLRYQRDEDRVEAIERRALEVAIEVLGLGVDPDDGIDDLVQSLLSRGADRNLSEAYRGSLRQLMSPGS
jgi:hypothetical protein